MLTPSPVVLLQWTAPVLPFAPAVRVAVPMKVPFAPPAASAAAVVPLEASLKAYHAETFEGAAGLFRLLITSVPVPFHAGLMIASTVMPFVTVRLVPLPQFTDAAAV